jgi:hypothetical protein
LTTRAGIVHNNFVALPRYDTLYHINSNPVKYFNNLDTDGNVLPGYDIIATQNGLRVVQPELGFEIEDTLLLALL